MKVRPGPGRDALRAGAGARHQVEPRDRPGRRYRPLDERGVGARRHRAGPQRHRHRAAQRASARRCSCASCCRPRHYEDKRLGLPLALGKDIGGDPVIADLARMPHLLIAGTTGSGKSVAINTMILSLLYRLPPDKCRFIMIDPKMLELSVYEDIPHLLAPVVTEPRKAIVALKWVVREMEDRYRAMSRSSACATSPATTSGCVEARAQGRGADPPGADRLRSRDAPADLRGRGDRPRRRCPSSSSSSTRWPT